MGIRILDLTRVLAGPWATQQLADQGAEVLKVEPPGGDETRAFGPIVNGQSTYFLACNRNKRSIVLDLQKPEARAVVQRLARQADVVIHNYRPGVAERLGVDYATLSREHPRLVSVAIHAFGDTGEPTWVKRAGYDLVLQALGGAMAITGEPGGPPTKNGTSVADLTAGLLAVQAVLFGLLHRERTGEGQHVVVNMMQGQAASLAYHATRLTVTGEVETQRGNSHFGLVPYGTWRCSDGWIALAVGNDRLWDKTRAVLGIDDVPAWRTNSGRRAARAEVDAAIQRVLSAWTVAETDAALSALGIPCGPVLSPDATIAHPAVTMAVWDDPDLGTVRAVGRSMATATTRPEMTRPPRLDEHRAQILAEAGYSEAEIAGLEAAGAFG